MGPRKLTPAEEIAELRAEAAGYMDIARRISLRTDRELMLTRARHSRRRHG